MMIQNRDLHELLLWLPFSSANEIIDFLCCFLPVGNGDASGDAIAYAIEDGRVVLTRYDETALAEDPFAAFSEWASAEDAEAYGRL